MLLELVLLAAAAGQTSGAATMPVTDGSPTACRSIADRNARLDCYDRAMTEAVSRPHDPGAAPAAAERVFRRGKPTRPAMASATESQIVTANRTANGRWSFRLADGTVWAQMDDRSLNIDPKAGQPIRIRPASMGTFFANVNRQVAIRVRPVG